MTAVLMITIVTIVLLILSPDSFNRDCAKVHNYYRRKHKTGSLSISKAIVEYAEKRAEDMRITDNFEHSKDRKYGENLYKIQVFGGGSNDVTCGEAVKLWYDEIKNYSFDRPNLMVSGHFTQIVWKSTQEIGCGKSYSVKSHTNYLICNYNPMANFIESEKENVPKPVSK